ncbi:MAG: hypothetical protein IJ570_03580 [Prevotella sp.]|nr:hypothetical protein [Prevotella sp.]
MKDTRHLFLVLAAATMALGSCYQDSTDQRIPEPTSTLNILTRADGNADIDETLQPAGRVYIFSGNSCVSMLDFTESNQTVAAHLAAGAFDVYAVGAPIIDRYELPDQNDAQPTSIIALADGKTMDDLLMTHTTSELQDGEEQNLNLTLGRKVLAISQATIKSVPASVTGVSIAFGPIHQNIMLNGTYSTETETVTIDLEKVESESGTWKTNAATYLLPSQGKPTITVRFSTATGTKSYAYTAADDDLLEANHQVTLTGTYTQTQGVDLSGTVTATKWGDPKTLSFDFDDNNITTSTNNDTPTGEALQVGDKYKGCYVIAVNGNTATLGSPKQRVDYSVSDADLNAAITVLETSLESWTIDEDITGEWRIPTLDELIIMLEDPTIVNLGSADRTYFYMEGTSLFCALFRYDNQSGKNIYKETDNSRIGPATRLRPVIDITF